MKYVKIFMILFVSLLLLANSTYFAYSMTNGFDVEPLTTNESEKIIAGIPFKRINAETAKDSIECFDVNENGLIAIGSENHSIKTISVYTDDGVFQYAFEFEDDGSFGIEWIKDSLNVYFVRGSIGLNIDSQGTVLNVFSIKDTADNNTYWNDVVFSQTRKVNGIDYKIDNDLGLLNLLQSSYSRLIKRTPNGVETVIYDVGNSQLFYSILWLGVILIVLIVAIISIAKQFKKNLESKNRDDRRAADIIRQALEQSENQK